MQIRELNLKDLYQIHELVSQYSLLTYDEFEDLIYDMRDMNYKMIGILEKNELVCYVGVCIQTNLTYKRHLQILDFVVDSKHNFKGYNSMMLQYLDDFAKIGMCKSIVLSLSYDRGMKPFLDSGYIKKYTTYIKGQ